MEFGFGGGIKTNTLGISAMPNGGGGQSTLYNNLVAYWALNEISAGSAPVSRLDSVGTNTLTDNNNCPSAAGKIGNAASFTIASSQSLSIADNAALSMGDVNMAMACWVNLAAIATSQEIVSKYTNTGGGREYQLFFEPSTPRFWFQVRNTAQTAFGTVVANNFGAPSAGTWYLLCANHDADNNALHISVNAGTRDTTAAYTGGIYNGTSAFRIGADNSGNYLGGLIDMVGVWKGRILTTAEEAELYNGGAGKALY